MEYRIFFNDGHSIRGPFSERQVQDWYRKKWFQNSLLFYFTRSDEFPSHAENNGITLDSLRSRYGNGCTFINFDENWELEMQREERKWKLEKMEKVMKYQEIADLQQNFTTILGLEEHIKKANGQLKIAKENFKANKVESIEPEKKKEQSVEEIGTIVSSLVLDAFAVYGSGDFGSWQKVRATAIESMLNEVKSEKERTAINLACIRILIEKMKEKDFFCCDPCKEALFNYKQTLIHFTSDWHCKKETEAVRQSGIDRVRGVLNSFTNLHLQLAKEDALAEQNRLRTQGSYFLFTAFGTRPDGEFMDKWSLFHGNAVFTDTLRMAINPLSDTILECAENAVANAKGPVGQKAMAELHKHLEGAKTFCVYCRFYTGDREGFYSHLISSVHMKAVGEGHTWFDLPTMLVNLHKKNLI